MSTTTSPVTFEQFENLPNSEFHQELLDGEVITLPPPKRSHAETVRRVEEVLWTALDRSRVWIELGLRIGDNWLIPDVSVLWPEQQVVDDYTSGSPMIAIEVASKGNTPEELDRKTQLYLSGGAAEVWVVYPRTRSMLVFRSDSDEALRITDEYDCARLGLAVRMKPLFSTP